MHKNIFVNLAVADLRKSTEFFRKLGYDFNPDFTNDNATSMIVGDNIYAMLLVKDFFKGFIDKPLCDATQATEVLVALSCESRAEVDDLVAKARAAGGAVPRPAQDLGFMYSHAFEDLDGHIWELVYMEPGAVPPKE